MGKLYSDWMFPFADSYIKTNLKGRCINRINWRVNWSNIIVTGISGIAITMPDIAHVSIFTDNDLTHITDDHFEIKLIPRLFNQKYVIQPPNLPPRYDEAPPDEYEYSQSPASIVGVGPSAPQFPEHLHSLFTHS